MGKSGFGAKSQGSGGYDEALATAGDRPPVFLCNDTQIINAPQS